MADARKILDGINHCLPATEIDNMMECITCPYYRACRNNNDREIVMVPIEMIEDMRTFLKDTLGHRLTM